MKISLPFHFELNVSVNIKKKEKYWIVFGGYTGKMIGLTSNKEDVLEEEPKATFRSISEKEYFKKYVSSIKPLNNQKSRLF